VKKWYAVYTKPHNEYRVARKLESKNIETYVPEIKSSGSRQKMPFFPNYLFVRIDLEVDHPKNWIWTPGLRYLVKLGGQPFAIADEIIQHIQKRIKTFEANLIKGSQFKPGDNVRIKKVPFQEMEAVFDKSITPNQRAQVLIKIFGNIHKIKIDIVNLEEK